MGIAEPHFTYQTSGIVRERALKATYEFLARSADDRISLLTLCDGLDYSPRHMRRIIQVLERMGVVERYDYFPNRAPRFRLFVDRAEKRGLINAGL
jgi:hypothetical protein